MSSSACCKRLLIIVVLSVSSLAYLSTLLPDHSSFSNAVLHLSHFQYSPSTPQHPILTPQNQSSSAVQVQAMQPHAAAQANRSLDPLRTLATIDLDEQLLAQQASLLLDETWQPSLTDRLWNSLLGVDEREQLEAARFRLAKQGRRIPIRLASPWYARRWPLIQDTIRRWAQNRRVYDPDVLFSLLMSVKAPIDEHYGKLPLASAEQYGYTVELGKPYRSCAVVGNSGTLLDKRYGSRIDAHEAVIRLNNARIAGFEKDVGFKTTLSFVNSNVLYACAGQLRCFCQAYGEHVPTLVYITQPAHFTEVTLCSETQKAPLLVTDPRLDKLCARLAKYYSLKRFVEEEAMGPGRRPAAEVVEQEWSAARDGPSFHYSSGMEAVLVALGVCREVSLFGFGKGGSQHHYHSSRQQRELHLHDYAAEYELYRHLHRLSLNRSAPSIPFLSDSRFPLPPLHVYGSLVALQ